MTELVSEQHKQNSIKIKRKGSYDNNRNNNNDSFISVIQTNVITILTKTNSLMTGATTETGNR